MKLSFVLFMLSVLPLQAAGNPLPQVGKAENSRGNKSQPMSLAPRLASSSAGDTATGFQPIDAAEQVKIMGRGVNILSGDPMWSNFKKARFQERHFQRIPRGRVSNGESGYGRLPVYGRQNHLRPASLKTLPTGW